jgi:hypothetical protein
MAYDESDVIKENHTYTDLLEITPSKLKPDEFVIQWQGGSKETYVCPHRNYLISSMLRLNELCKKVKPVKYKTYQLTRAGEVNLFPHLLFTCSASNVPSLLAVLR